MASSMVVVPDGAVGAVPDELRAWAEAGRRGIDSVDRCSRRVAGAAADQVVAGGPRIGALVDRLTALSRAWVGLDEWVAEVAEAVERADGHGTGDATLDLARRHEQVAAFVARAVALAPSTGCEVPSREADEVELWEVAAGVGLPLVPGLAMTVGDGFLWRVEHLDGELRRLTRVERSSFGLSAEDGATVSVAVADHGIASGHGVALSAEVLAAQGDSWVVPTSEVTSIIAKDLASRGVAGPIIGWFVDLDPPTPDRTFVEVGAAVELKAVQGFVAGAAQAAARVAVHQGWAHEADGTTTSYRRYERSAVLGLQGPGQPGWASHSDVTVSLADRPGAAPDLLSVSAMVVGARGPTEVTATMPLATGAQRSAASAFEAGLVTGADPAALLDTLAARSGGALDVRSTTFAVTDEAGIRVAASAAGFSGHLDVFEITLTRQG